MNTPIEHNPDPSLDLLMERVVDVPKELVWQAWTQPELLKRWFTPAPWKTTECEIDLRPGGKFYTKMQGPEGEEFSGSSCYLEIVENQKLVWTSALMPGYRPYAEGSGAESCGPFVFTAVITMEDEGSGTRYRAMAIHADPEGRRKHDEMGFHDGWGAAFDQLLALVRAQPASQ